MANLNGKRGEYSSGAESVWRLKIVMGHSWSCPALDGVFGKEFPRPLEFFVGS
jgi:hypothetical protein